MDKRRWIVLLISFNFALIFVLAGFIYQQRLELGQLHRVQEEGRTVSLVKLSESVAEMDLALRKGRYAASPETFTAVATALYGRAAEAAVVLEKLPIETEETAAWFAHVRDYARTLARTAHGRDGHAPGERAELEALSETIALVRAAFGCPPLELEPTLEAMAQIEEQLTGTTPVSAPAEAGTTVEIARAELAAFTGLRENIFTHTGSHKFRARIDGGDFTAEVCRASGRVMRMETARQVRTAALTAEEGIALAEDFLTRNGYEGVTLRRWRREGHRVAAQFVPVSDGVLIYPDAVQISIALDNGRVTDFVSAAHREREPPMPAVTKEEALTAVPDTLIAEDYDMVILAIAGGREALCYAFRCRAADGQAVLVYVNAETGRQQEIRLLIEDETGHFPLYI
ncbi:MAG: germination protein YpeB [Oscillospiraceae bacterium]|nr:germination protein YpeB [Oscillospiraceae bacterium]